jgi:hypothetical protein
VASLAHLATCYPVPDGEAWLSVKIDPDFDHSKRWQCLPVATWLKASLLQPLSPPRAASRETPDLGLLDTLAMRGAVLPLGPLLEQTLEECGSEVEPRVSSRVDEGGSRRRGATDS